jgi:hypothetical protein
MPKQQPTPERVEPIDLAALPKSQWQIDADAEAARLAGLGLVRREGGGLTSGEMQVAGWLLRLIEQDMGRDTAKRVLALSALPVSSFDADWRTFLDHHNAGQGEAVKL